MSQERLLVAGYGAGSNRPHELQDCLDAIWSEVIGDPERRDRAASALGVKPEHVAASQRAPFVFETPRAGTTAADIAVIVATWAATHVLLGAVADLAKDVVKTRLKALWRDVLEPEMRKRLRGRNALGSERSVDVVDDE